MDVAMGVEGVGQGTTPVSIPIDIFFNPYTIFNGYMWLISVK